MKTSKKIKIWARIGQIALWVLCACFLLISAVYQLCMYGFVVSGDAISILEVIAFLFIALLSEAIVRVIGYFAELLDK